ncbi:C4-dicarboxylic acid transporter DauA [Planctomycetales bacterium ZRK34]|nr:C4-dicarboxylic acid transporter DauA [Planctomycetales bacterium ZRK34]
MNSKSVSRTSPVAWRPFWALRSTLRDGYGAADLRADLMAGLVVGTVALPLSMALAIAAGAPPQHGLYTAIVAGAVIALLGGSRVQVSGPTAAFVVILAPISAQYGLGGLMIATVLAGGLLIAMGLAKFGRLIQFIPHPVVTGFTAGIATVIAMLQFKDLLGVHIEGKPAHFSEHIEALITALPTTHWPDVMIGLLTLGLLIIWPRVTRKVPAPMVGLITGGVTAWVMTQLVDGFEVATIASRFSYEVGDQTGRGIPPSLPTFAWPWTMPGGDGQAVGLSWALVRDLVPAGFAIAMLGAIESLLSAVVADGMTGQQHDPDAELFAQGAGNLIAPFFGGIAATGAIARTATNIRSGGRSPIAAIVHAVFVLAAMLVLAPLLGYLPMASLAALLIIVAWNMSEMRHFVHTVRVAPRSDTMVLLSCFALTVAVDMVVAVSVGIVMAALLFMRRMAEISSAELISDKHHASDTVLPPGVVVYEIRGPLFFGAAQKAINAMRTIGSGVRVVVLDMSSVPAMDATGLVNLESAIARLEKMKLHVIVAGVQPQPLHLLARSRMKRNREMVTVCSTFEAAMDTARWHAAEEPAPTTPTPTPATITH